MKTQIRPHQKNFSTTDIGLYSFLRMSGYEHTALDVNQNGQVKFVFEQNGIGDFVIEYLMGKTRVDPLRYKVELDHAKKLVFAFLRTRGVMQ